MIDREALKAEIIARRGYWHPFHEGLLELAPEFLQTYLHFQDAPARSGHLEPKVCEFIYIAIDGAVSHLYERGLRRHIEDALRLGATKEEVLQVIMLATCAEGQIPNALGHAILMEEARTASAPLTPEQQRRKDAYVEKTGTWPQAGDAIVLSERMNVSLSGDHRVFYGFQAYFDAFDRLAEARGAKVATVNAATAVLPQLERLFPGGVISL